MPEFPDAERLYKRMETCAEAAVQFVCDATVLPSPDGITFTIPADKAEAFEDACVQYAREKKALETAPHTGGQSLA
jgi:hypothetical protein